MALFMFMSLCLFPILFAPVLGAPLEPRTVFAPPITSPTSSSVWKVGQVETVTWNATGIPAGVLGKVQLGFLTSDSENLSLILASGFNLTDQKVDITVPDVVSRTNYIIVLFGDSGNISPEFTIQGSTSASAPSASSTSTSPHIISSSAAGKTGALSATPSPPIATAPSSSATPSPPIATAPSGSAVQSTATAPASTSTGSEAGSIAITSSSPSFPSASSSTVSSSSPSSTPSNAGWSTNTLQLLQVIVAPAVAALILVL